MGRRPGQPDPVQPAGSGNTAGEGSLRGTRRGQHQPNRPEDDQHLAQQCCGSVDAQHQPDLVSEQREAAGEVPGRLFSSWLAQEPGRPVITVSWVLSYGGCTRHLHAGHIERMRRPVPARKGKFL
jgi:hypothetical protein